MTITDLIEQNAWAITCAERCIKGSRSDGTRAIFTKKLIELLRVKLLLEEMR